MSIVAFLASLPGFKNIEPEALETISARVEPRSFAAGEYLIRRGEPGDNMHILRSGNVRIPIFDAKGHEKSVFHLSEGDFVGEMALLTGELRAADVIAEGAVETLVIDRELLQPLLAEHPGLAGFLTEILGRRLQEGGGIERVGKYRLLGKLGEGATGKVYEALHPGLNRVVAIKMLSHSLVYNAAFRDRFLEEARTVAGLTHPNIVQVFDTESAYATYFIVMEKLDGPDLTQLLKARGKLTAAETMKILRQMGAALAYAHKQGFAHRDVKPANVAIDDKLNLKLMDFGLARPIPKDADGKKSKTVEGTPQYLAPETALGQPPDGRVDIYAMGVMAFEMVAGRLPFTANKVVELLQAHVRTPPPDVRDFAPDLPDNLVEFIRGALIKKPAERLTDWTRIQELLDDRVAVPSLWSDAVEQVIRIRFNPSAASEVERAVSGLLGELGNTPGVEVAHGSLARVVSPAKV